MSGTFSFLLKFVFVWVSYRALHVCSVRKVTVHLHRVGTRCSLGLGIMWILFVLEYIQGSVKRDTAGVDLIPTAGTAGATHNRTNINTRYSYISYTQFG